MRYLILLSIILLGVTGIFFFVKEQKMVNDHHVVTTLDRETTQQPLTVTGKIPEWLKGTYVRNGPVSFTINGKEVPHWFDGLAMLHAFSFENNQVVYSNKFLRTDPYREVFERGNMYFGGFATPSRQSIWQKILSFVRLHKGPYLQNANVNVAEIAKQYVALTETPLPVRFEIKNMDTLGALEFQDNLPKGDTFESVHLQTDNKNKEKINYLVEYGKDSKYVVYRYNPNIPAREVISEILVKNPAYMHSFALTENNIILVEFPFTVKPLDLMFSKKGFIENFAWHPEQGTNFIIIDRKTGKSRTINYPKPFFAFHHVNAYETGDNIILDIVTYPDATVISNVSKHGEPYTSDNIASEKKLDETMRQAKLVRYTLSLKDAFNGMPNGTLNGAPNGMPDGTLKENTVTSEILFEKPIEFPRINENYNTQDYRYAYLVDPRDPSNKKDLRPLYKIDTKTKETKTWSEAGTMPGEPVFIANPTGTDEDDGVIVTIVLDNYKQNSFLLMLDGKSFKEIARSYAPYAIPLGLHGQFFK